MKKKISKFIKPNNMDSETVITILGDEEEIQSYAEANFGRKLSDIELHRFSYEALYREDDDVYPAVLELMNALVSSALKEKEVDWSSVDNMLLDQLDSKEKEECLKQHSKLIKGI